MSIPDHLKIDISELNLDELLAEWEWCVPDDCRPLFMTFLGDLFMLDSTGKVLLLDLQCGTFEQVATSESSFSSLMENREQRTKWIPGWLFIELKKTEGELAKGQCYSCRVPLNLGGRLEASNFTKCDVAVHYSVLGQLQSRVAKLPPGTRITDFRFADGEVSSETHTSKHTLISSIKGLFGR